MTQPNLNPAAVDKDPVLLAAAQKFAADAELAVNTTSRTDYIRAYQAWQVNKALKLKADADNPEPVPPFRWHVAWVPGTGVVTTQTTALITTKPLPQVATTATDGLDTVVGGMIPDGSGLRYDLSGATIGNATHLIAPAIAGGAPRIFILTDQGGLNYFGWKELIAPAFVPPPPPNFTPVLPPDLGPIPTL